jgi:sulfur carrier protein
VAVRVTLEVVGGSEHELELEDATYGDLLGEIGLSPNEVAVLVDGRPVPEDQPVDADRARVLRLVAGGVR